MRRQPYYIVASGLPARCLEGLIRRTGRYVIIPFYHVVSNERLPHIRNLYTYRDVDSFQRDLDFLQAHFLPIQWTEIEEAQKRQQPSFCMTFDDGLSEVYTIIAPILKSRGIPALCFVNSGFVGNKGLFSRYAESLHHNEPAITEEEFLDKHRPYMTWDQIKELQAMGWQIGGHSVSHPHYNAITEEEQKKQTEQCMAEIAKHLSIENRLFAYPFGEEGQVSTQSFDAVFGTRNLRQAQSPMYNRVWMEGYHYSAKSIIIGEYLREWCLQRYDK